MIKYAKPINKKYQIVIFDLDGVILNSKENMRLSWNDVNKHFNLKTPFHLYFKNIGMPFKTILKKIGIKNKLDEIQQMYFQKSKKYKNNVLFYDEVEETIKYLLKKKYKIGIVTSKDLKRTNIFLSKLSIKFHYIVCPSQYLKGKPHPDQILSLLKKSKIDNTKAIYIGDTIIDKKAALNAKIDFIFAEYGYGKIYSNKVKKIKSFNKLLQFL